MAIPSRVPRLAGVRLRNVRGFDNLALRFGPHFRSTTDGEHPLNRVAVVIGRNGTNKSTLLRSIAIGSGTHNDVGAMLTAQLGSLVRTGELRADIELFYEFEDGNTVRALKVIERSSRGYDELVHYDGPPADELGLLVCGYGAARGVTGTDSGSHYRLFDAVATLFDYRRELLAPELTLRRLADYLGDDDRFERAMANIARAIGLDDSQARIVAGKGGGVQISSQEIGVDVPLEGLADGYRVAFNWMMDLYGRALRPGWITPSGSVAALILVDEIDQHLHPELQTRVVSELSRTFPESQFIVSTHSPLVALGTDPSQLVVLHRDERGTVQAADDVPDYRAYTPDEMLADDRLFDVEAHNPEFENLLQRYDQLGSKPASERSAAETDQLREVAEAVRAAPRPGYSQSELAAATREILSNLSRDDDRH